MRTPGLAVVRLGVPIGVAFVLTQAGVPVAAAATADPAGSLPISSCPAGSQLYLPVSSSLEANGWVDVRYDIGTAVDVEVPPLGFDIVAAPDDVVASHNLRTVRDAMRQAGLGVGRSRSASRTRGLCVDHTMSNTVTTRTSRVWGGSDVRATSTYSFNGVAAWYVQPTPVYATCGSAARVSSWVGLGGDASGIPLIQTGSIAWAPPNLAYAAFYELIGGNGHDYGTVYFNFYPKGGDRLYAYVLYSYPNASVQVVDATTGYWGSAIVNMNGWDPRASAEWIDERQGGVTDLAKYGKTSWSSMQVSRTNANAWTGAYSEPNQIKWNIVASQTDSTTSGISSGNTMSNTWIYCN